MGRCGSGSICICFKKNNPWALEEIGRRLLEAESRWLWEAEDVEQFNQALQEMKKKTNRA